MQDSDWVRLAAPFPSVALVWRIQEIAPDRSSVRLRPQLRPGAVTSRLDEVVAVHGWSFRCVPFSPAAVGCELTIGGVTKSAVAADPSGTADQAALCRDALARAAEYFGLLPPADPDGEYWVDYDAESGAPLFEPDVVPAAGPRPAPAEPGDGGGAEAARPLGEPSGEDDTKPQGQRIIDRLVERLRAEGRGLEAAKLLVEYQGYGRDPAAARELYSKLRALLLERGPEAG